MWDFSQSYEAQTRNSEAARDALSRLRVAAESRADEIAAIDVLESRAAREELLIDRFKIKNELLQYSIAAFVVSTSHLVETSNKSLTEVATKLAGAMMRHTIDRAETTARGVRDLLAELALLQPPPRDVDAFERAISEGRLICDLSLEIDAIVRTLVVERSDREQDVVRALIMKRQLDARSSARRYRLSLYGASLVMLGVLLLLGLQLWNRALVLRRRAAFEHVISDISMRFINSQHFEMAAHVESALAKLAEFLDADRAYFATTSEPTRTYRWARRGVVLREDWPELALKVASHCDLEEDGVIYIPKVRPCQSDEATNLLATAGLQSWLCVPSLGKSTCGMLGFDTVHPGASVSRIEVSLLRMAFDAIANAVARAGLEREKERLQANLQHAGRMETIGTFAVGIAHNFNNIVAAIVGYTEIADARITSGKEPVESFVEIRKAAERARELVDQILSFGRRGEGRCELISVLVLISEAMSLLSASLPNHIDVSVSSASEDAMVTAEAAQLQQVILNVCNNAAQAMDDPGVIEIYIAIQEVTAPIWISHRQLDPGYYSTISISDSGRGMDQATLSQVFEPFFTTRSNGSGLGLATVREIVAAA